MLMNVITNQLQIYYEYYEYQITEVFNENRNESLTDHSRIFTKYDECSDIHNETVVNIGYEYLRFQITLICNEKS